MNDILQSAKNVYDLGSAVIVVISAMAVAFSLRALNMSPRRIPMSVILFAGALSILIQPNPPEGTRARIAWDAKLFAIGIGLGFIAMSFYRPIMKRIGGWIGVKDEDEKKEDDK